ncbi:MAG TPA: DUF917 domain-containing protein [Thermoplasmata archaeon]|nr:DUF917 domain-containing protein [Thermoplasmata archaeon]
MKSLDREYIEDLATGAAILGTGGGGDPYLGKLTAFQALEDGYDINLIDVKEIPNDALIVPSAGMGSPAVIIEKIPKGTEIIKSFETLSKYLGREVYATMPMEAGGLNSTVPLAVGAKMGIPVVDADGMGRAFPELQMTTFHVNGVTVTPMSLADERGNTVLLKTCDNYWAEWIARDITVRFGGVSWVALYSMSGEQLKKGAISGTISLAQKLGSAIREAKESRESPIEALLKTTRGVEIFKGKIVDVERRTVKGFARGKAEIEGIEGYKGEKLMVQFQNENLVAVRGGEVVASVPDLITVLDLETAQPITTESIKYGHRCFIIGIPCNRKWRTEQALKVVGPKYFGYDVEYKPLVTKR